MTRARRSRLVELLWRLHRWVYRSSGGRVGGRLIGMPVVLLTTRGRRTGRSHVTALTYLEEDGNCVIVASNGGAPTHPAWLLNLRAHPEADIQVGQRRLRVRAREAGDAERERLWAQIVRVNRGYAVYQTRTTRRIPVVVLEPSN